MYTQCLRLNKTNITTKILSDQRVIIRDLFELLKKNFSASDCSFLKNLKTALSDFLKKIPKNPCTGTVDMAF